jgi:xanthine dehydrogenase accessory factor
VNRIEQDICKLLARGQSFILATVVGRQGAAPRTAGSKMIITGEGRGIGTIGGGLLEADVTARAVELIERKRSGWMHFDMSGDIAATTDMVCGGSLDVLLAFVPSTAANRALFERWLQVVETKRSGCLVTVALPAGDTLRETGHCLVIPTDPFVGSFPLGRSALQTVLSAAQAATGIEILRLDEALVVLEPVPRVCSALLFGGGHVARPTARLAAMVGFEVWVSDDRPDFVTRKRFPDAHQLRVLDSFERAFTGLRVDSSSYVIIFTRGHLHDKIVLAQALATDAGYIGMIGSRRKRDTIYSALQAEGVDPARIERVHCPIGAAIGAETPEEIAVSIVAEMIMQRSQNK